MNMVQRLSLHFKTILHTEIHIHVKLPKMPLAHFNASITMHKMNIFPFLPTERQSFSCSIS